MTNLAKIIKFPDQKINQGREYVKADTDNGYYRVANELGQALCKVHLSDRESRIVQAIMLKTFGWQKATDWVCNSQLSELTDIGITHISNIKKALKDRNIIITEGRKIGVNPVVSEWTLTKKEHNKNNLPTLNKKPEQVKPTPEQVKNIPQTGAHKRKTLNTKDTITKDIVKTQISSRTKKPEQFKQFFKLYPAHRKGGTDAQAWKAWKSEKFTDEDARAALDWITLTAEVNPDWATDANGQFVFGITNFIRDKKWLTPTPQVTSKTTGNNKSVSDHNQDAMDEWLSRHPHKTEIEVNPNEQ
jgi:phage replication O-like protein O